MVQPADQPELHGILTSTRVGELVLSIRPALEPEDPVSAAAAEMRSASHGSALVCENGRLVGIFTERDLLGVLGSGRGLETPLRDVMTAAPRTVTVTDTLFDAMRWMDEGGYRRLPVVDRESRPVGIVDVKTVAHFIVEHYPAAIYNQAAHEQLIARHREGA